MSSAPTAPVAPTIATTGAARETRSDMAFDSPVHARECKGAWRQPPEQPSGCICGGRALVCNLEVAHMENRIEKRIELKAPLSRVWRALTDYREFGQWFRVKLEGPFVAGQLSQGQITHPGYEHVRWQAVVQKIEPERLFSFTWHPYGIDPQVDYS